MTLFISLFYESFRRCSLFYFIKIHEIKNESNKDRLNHTNIIDSLPCYIKINKNKQSHYMTDIIMTTIINMINIKIIREHITINKYISSHVGIRVVDINLFDFYYESRKMVIL